MVTIRTTLLDGKDSLQEKHVIGGATPKKKWHEPLKVGVEERTRLDGAEWAEVFPSLQHQLSRQCLSSRGKTRDSLDAFIHRPNMGEGRGSRRVQIQIANFKFLESLWWPEMLTGQLSDPL